MSISFPTIVPGFNPTTIVDGLMAAYKLPLTALQQKQTVFGTQQQTITQIQGDYSAFEQAVSQLSLGATISAKVATTNTVAGQPAALSASAGSDAANGSYLITVKQLATSTRITSTSPNGLTSAAIGQAINPTALLANAGFGQPVTNGSFTINGVAITVDANTKLSDPGDLSNSLIDKINSSGAGVTASLANDAYGRPNVLQLVSSSGQAIQLGNTHDTSNFLAVSGLLGGAIVGNTASSVAGNSVAGGTLNATISVNGTSVAITQGNASFTGAQNAAFIQNALNAAHLGVTASVIGAGSDQLQLTQNTPGSQQTIALSVSGADAAAIGLANGTTRNGTDRVVGATPLGEVNPNLSLSVNALGTPLVTDGTGGGTLSINGVSIAWNQSDSLNNILTRINGSAAQVRATYDPLSDRVTLSSTQTGGAAVSMQDTSGNLLQSLHLLTNPTTSVPQQLGQNAIVNIAGVNNGNDLVVPSNTVSGYIPGVSLTLQQASLTPTTLTIGQDTQTTVNAVQTFVTTINTLLGDIDKATAQNTDPTKAGVMAGDAGLIGLGNTLRQMLSTQVTGAASGFQDLTTVGVSTGPIGSAVGTTTTYQLDTAKLTQALQSNPTAVQQLFIGDSINPGIAVSLQTYANNLLGINGYFATELQGITNSQQDLTKQINSMQDQLNQRQAMLTTQYTQLEATIASLQSQSTQVSSIINSLSLSMTTSSSSH